MNVKRPWTALCIWFAAGVVLYAFGVRDGSLLIFDLLAGIFIYKVTDRY